MDMSLTGQLFAIAFLIVLNLFLSLAEISLAAARKTRLRMYDKEGNIRAKQVLALQNNPGQFFAAIQVGTNAITILAGIIGESVFTPFFVDAISLIYQGSHLNLAAFILSFLTATSLFILFADLIPRRMALLYPEKIAFSIVTPMKWTVWFFAPFVWFYNGVATFLLNIFGVSSQVPEDISFEDISAVLAAGVEAGVLEKDKSQLIDNVFDLENRQITSSMTARESVVWLPISADVNTICETVSQHRLVKYLVCDGVIDRLIGYIDSRDVLVRVIKGETETLKIADMVHQALVVPDTLSLSEILLRFKAAHENFAVVLNEYALVVGVISLDDVMSTVMGDLVEEPEPQIVKRDDRSWLMDGVTPISDVMRTLEIDGFPGIENYETIAGFVMYRLRKIPKRTDSLFWAGYKFEIVDIDNYKIDVLLVTKEDEKKA